MLINNKNTSNILGQLFQSCHSIQSVVAMFEFHLVIAKHFLQKNGKYSTNQLVGGPVASLDRNGKAGAIVVKMPPWETI